MNLFLAYSLCRKPKQPRVEGSLHLHNPTQPASHQWTPWPCLLDHQLRSPAVQYRELIAFRTSFSNVISPGISHRCFSVFTFKYPFSLSGRLPQEHDVNSAFIQALISNHQMHRHSFSCLFVKVCAKISKCSWLYTWWDPFTNTREIIESSCPFWGCSSRCY